MKRNSLRLRLLLGAVAAITVALAISGFALVGIFERYLGQRLARELDNVALFLSGNLEFDKSGGLLLDQLPADPRYEKPLSGSYWQIEAEDGKRRITSRSLWDNELKLPALHANFPQTETYALSGPDQKPVISFERRVKFNLSGRQVVVRFVVAANSSEISSVSREFSEELFVAMIALGLALVVASMAQIYFGLKPLAKVRSYLGEVRAGTRDNLPTDHPEELNPLVTEVNELLCAQRRSIQRARSRASDLAHGLKTPLSALMADVKRLRGKGETEIAGAIEMVGESMRRHVERELAQFRSAAIGTRGHYSTEVRPVVERLVETIRRTPHGDDIAFNIDLAPHDKVAIQQDDLSEVLGNLIDNAARYAGENVNIFAERNGAGYAIIISDDGEGMSAEQRKSAVDRGRRFDERGTGSGLGLAIARDILQTYGHELELERSEHGGLKARLVVHGHDLT